MLPPYFESSKAYPLVYQALDYRSIRQDMISSNIANVDTPFYRPRDVDFESYLAKEKAEIFEDKPDLELKMAQTSPMHLKGKNFDENQASMFFRDGHLARNDGNSVDLDVETSEMGKNSVMYQALTTALKKHKGIFAYAIDSGKNL
ncbi:flagellar basal body rod protein FlgB [Helicobacter sp. 12S02232-10]|uniref:flagellar basal body rod protein FlgB n=1 Tax=Helicobacter sp. 12S02232-10 TaxID=1476197 RepID=UPI000BA53C6C|nr:flagellar basal body rod protein FlgB [Helicobacter sp. 12S02232-10]PAF47250.1 flagellar basal body rod protein FlgB [Helicobacter sp. 12S02232-10]